MCMEISSRQYDMVKYIDEFEQLFYQLEKMGELSKISECYKVPLRSASMGMQSLLKNAVFSLHLKKINALKWEILLLIL